MTFADIFYWVFPLRVHPYFFCPAHLSVRVTFPHLLLSDRVLSFPDFISQDVYHLPDIHIFMPSHLDGSFGK